MAFMFPFLQHSLHGGCSFSIFSLSICGLLQVFMLQRFYICYVRSK